jgi:uncharacterized protein (TIGR02646 family)
MIPIRRPAASAVLSRAVRQALARRQRPANALPAGDPKIKNLWANFLKSKQKEAVATALDNCFRSKCAYCEGVAAQDIEHFRPKTQFPARMFKWDNFLRGCKNCNNFKLDKFPLAPDTTPLLLDPCRDEPLDYFVWDFETGAIGLRPDAGYKERAGQSRDILRLDLQPLREERRSKLVIVLCLLALVVNNDPVAPETATALREELDQRRPWLGIIRQLFRRPGPRFATLVGEARRKLPGIDSWIAPWV